MRFIVKYRHLQPGDVVLDHVNRPYLKVERTQTSANGFVLVMGQPLVGRAQLAGLADQDVTVERDV